LDDFVGKRIEDAPLGAAGVLEFVEQPVVMATVETVVEIAPPGLLRALWARKRATSAKVSAPVSRTVVS
jgi:hypothetical protein